MFINTENEFDYYRAQKITDALLSSGLISLSEYNKITSLNRLYFSPFLANIMPVLRCYPPNEEVICDTTKGGELDEESN